MRTIFHWKHKDKVDLPNISKPIRILKGGINRHGELQFRIKYPKRKEGKWTMPGSKGSDFWTKEQLIAMGGINLSEAKRRK